MSNVKPFCFTRLPRCLCWFFSMGWRPGVHPSAAEGFKLGKFDLELRNSLFQSIDSVLVLAYDLVSGAYDGAEAGQFFGMFGNRLCMRPHVVLNRPQALCDLWMVTDLIFAVVSCMVISASVHAEALPARRWSGTAWS